MTTTIKIESVYRILRDSPYVVRIKYGSKSDQFVDLKEGDKFDIPDDAIVTEDV